MKYYDLYFGSTIEQNRQGKKHNLPRFVAQLQHMTAIDFRGQEGNMLKLAGNDGEHLYFGQIMGQRSTQIDDPL